MYKFIKIRHDIIKQCHGNYKEMKKFNYKLEIEIFRNSTLNKPNASGVPRCLLKNLTANLEKWVKVTGNVNLSEIFYRYTFGINLRSLLEFFIELSR